MNNITLIGRVGVAPVLKVFTDSDTKLAKFSIAVKDYSSRSDQKETQWFDIDAWGGLADRVMDIVKQGRQIGITGRLVSQKYPKDFNGVTMQVTKYVIKLTAFDLLGAKPEGEEETAQAKETSTRKPRKAAA